MNFFAGVECVVFENVILYIKLKITDTFPLCKNYFLNKTQIIEMHSRMITKKLDGDCVATFTF